MKKNKLFTLALLSGVLTMSSCDDFVDGGCEVNQPNITSWEILKKGVEKNEDGTVAAGTAIVVYGTNLSDITSISFFGKEAEILPAFVSDKQIVFQIPEGIPEDCTAHIVTKSCPTGFDTDMLKVVVSAPCVAMCDNEFAVKTLKVVGNSLFPPLKAKFFDGKDYTLVASTEDGTIKIDDDNHATITIPKGVKDGGNIVFEGNAGESVTDFIFRDTRNMLITQDDEEYLNKYCGMKPDLTQIDAETNKEVGLKYPKEDVISKWLKSDNTNGEFAIFHRDGSEFVGLSYEPYFAESNPTGDDPKYATAFGAFGADIAKGKMSPNDFAIKFEVLVNEAQPMKGDNFTIGFFDALGGKTWVDIRDYCAQWQPSLMHFSEDEDHVWDVTTFTCDAWSCEDWITVSIPVSSILYDFKSAGYTHCAQNNREENAESANPRYFGFGDKKAGLSYFETHSNYQEIFTGDSPTDLDDASATGLAIVLGSWDSPDQLNKDSRHPYIGVDNVRIVPKNENGGEWPLTKWGDSSRDFYKNPVMSCVK